jgi:hypothetical protein
VAVSILAPTDDHSQPVATFVGVLAAGRDYDMAATLGSARYPSGESMNFLIVDAERAVTGTFWVTKSSFLHGYKGKTGVVFTLSTVVVSVEGAPDEDA